MLALLLALAPLLLKIGLGAIDLFSTNAKAKADLKQSLQQWFDLHKADAAKSASEHASYAAQEAELKASETAEKPPQA